jgi:hypothetical protein
VRVMADDAGLALGSDMALDRLQVLVVVAIAAELQNILGQQRVLR